MPEYMRLDGGENRRTLSLLILVALLGRLLIVLIWGPRDSLSGDPSLYLKDGIELAQTAHYPGNPVQAKMPGMAVIVAGGYAMGGTVGARYLPQCAFAALAVLATVALWLLLRPHMIERWHVPSLALLLFAVPTLSIPVFRLLPDLPALCLAVLAVYCMSRWSTARPVTAGTCAGILLAMCAYLRTDYGLVVILCAGTHHALSPHSKAAAGPAPWGCSMSVLLAVFLLLLPWGFRNRAETGQFRIFNDQGQRALGWAFNDQRNLDWVATGREPFAQLTVQDQGRVAVNNAMNWILAHPADAASLIAWRLVSHIQAAPPIVVRAAANQIPVRIMRQGFRLMLWVLHEFWILLGVFSLTMIWRRLPSSFALLGSVVIGRLLVACLYPDGGRYALIIYPFLACMTLLFLGSTHRQPICRYIKPAILVGSVVLAIQLVFILRWETL